MKSKASIGNHPIHPLLVPVPIGAFCLVLVGDIAHLLTADPFWYRFSTVAINVGIAFAIVAAVVGAIDYLGLRLNRRANTIATWHALTNVAVVSLYAFSDVIRMGGAGLRSGRWWTAFTCSTTGFVLLAVAGWLGGKLAYEERVGVIEAAGAVPAAEKPSQEIPPPYPDRGEARLSNAR